MGAGAAGGAMVVGQTQIQLGAVEETAGEEGLMGWMIAAGGDGAGES